MLGFTMVYANITIIVTEYETILFGVRASDPQDPIQAVVCRGSKYTRREVQTFVRRVAAGEHGKVAPAE